MSAVEVQKQNNFDFITNLLSDPVTEELETFKNLDQHPFVITSAFLIRNKSSFQWKIKRAVDFIGSVVGIMLISPILFLIALAIKIDSPGPILFKQKRVGLNGEHFDMYKFRSMQQDAEQRLKELLKYNETNEAMFKMSNDPRMTRVGRFLRKYSLDELPQLLNVVKGEMSLVGPRPPIVSEVNSYKPWHYVRFATLPGLTGLWQVSGRSSIDNFDQVVELDFTYINKWNLFLDTFILFKTVPVVLFGKDTA